MLADHGGTVLSGGRQPPAFRYGQVSAATAAGPPLRWPVVWRWERTITTDLPRRRNSLRYPGYDYAQPGGVHVTICTEHRQHLLGIVRDGEMTCSAAGVAAIETWDAIPARFPTVMVDGSVVMPDHLHGILFTVSTRNAPKCAGPSARLCAGSKPRCIAGIATGCIVTAGRRTTGNCGSVTTTTTSCATTATWRRSRPTSRPTRRGGGNATATPLVGADLPRP